MQLILINLEIGMTEVKIKKNILAFAQETPPPPNFLSSQILGRRKVKSATTMTQGDTRRQTDKSARRKEEIQSKTIMIFCPSRYRLRLKMIT